MMMTAKTVFRFLAVPWGLLIGYIAAWALWMMIYGIGARVIEDWDHYEYAGRVHLAGTVVGGIIGLAAGILCRRPLTTVFLCHLVAGLAATFLPMGSWGWGLATYSAWLAVAFVVAACFSKSKERKAGANKAVLPIAAGAAQADR
jgi:hypothetical protein